ncbi:hypothetical protein CHISP_2074 [Chitinispirillum alkaliphilum]|nr:hypothetical protein CHISP_2074 [Chitinispirillum alkaliphilum]
MEMCFRGKNNTGKVENKNFPDLIQHRFSVPEKQCLGMRIGIGAR